MDTHFKIITAGAQQELDRIKGSRFIATVRALADASELDGLLQPLRATFPEANHHCWAWRLGRSRDHFRWSDNGEPAGSAGRPILQQIESRQLTNVAVIVTRIFGGTKLGVGGLIRAYSSAAAAALELCPQEPWIIRRRVDLSYAYEFDGIIKSELQQSELEPESIQYDDEVHQTIQVPEADVESLLARLRDHTAGRIRAKTEGPAG